MAILSQLMWGEANFLHIWVWVNNNFHACKWLTCMTAPTSWLTKFFDPLGFLR